VINSPAVNEDDHSNSFTALIPTLVGDNGVNYRAFRKTLRPRFLVVWLQLGFIFAALGATLFVLWHIPNQVFVSLASGIAGAFVIGVTMMVLSNFAHEAAHYNLAPSRFWNDLLANALIGAITGTAMDAYRPVHMDHHRYLGTVRDPENNYWRPLSYGLIAKSLLGITMLKMVLARFTNQNRGGGKKQVSVTVAAGFVLHAVVLYAALSRRHYALAGAWITAFAVVWPLCLTLRQILEHRAPHAAGDLAYYATVDHGALTRMFSSDHLVGPIFGAAGFNRHLLHHWDPQVSYTRLADLEMFLRRTNANEILSARDTTYTKAFRLLNGDSACSSPRSV